MKRTDFALLAYLLVLPVGLPSAAAQTWGLAELSKESIA